MTNIKWTYAILNALAFLLMITVNTLAYLLPIGGRTTGEVSAMFPTLITPASYAFSIWGLIYTLLGGFVILQLLPSWREVAARMDIGPWFIISCLLNSAWIVAWHYLKIKASVFIMIALLVVLIVLYIRTRPIAHEQTPILAKLFIGLPFSIYLGWISVATILNVTIFLQASGWDGWGLPPALWAVILLVLAFTLALAMLTNYRDIAFVLTIAWALIAIGVNQTEVPDIRWMAWLLSGFLVISAVLLFFQRYRNRAR